MVVFAAEVAQLFRPLIRTLLLHMAWLLASPALDTDIDGLCEVSTRSGFCVTVSADTVLLVLVALQSAAWDNQVWLSEP